MCFRLSSVVIEQGKLQGKIENDIYGCPFLSFLGIPYAKSPSGELRLKPPQAPEKWEGTRNATKQSERCYSYPGISKWGWISFFFTRNMGSENCLCLNVFTHKVNASGNCELKPVMVFIHGGAFVLGSSDRGIYGPEFLMTEDIVLVTIQYRLGALGFLAVDDPSLEATGNSALKDQVQALKWVQKNIKQFCGDPNNVTIFGQSAGAACVHFLVLSPVTKGLFHKAIIQSGCALCPWSRGMNDAKNFAKRLGCNETDDKKVLEFLQQVPVKKLFDLQTKIAGELSASGDRFFGPSVEPKTKSAFLWEEPWDLLSSGVYNHVPLMIGYTTGEGIFVAHGKKLGVPPNCEHFVPYYFGYEKDSQEYQDLNKKIKLFYFGTEKPDVNKEEIFYDVFTDTIFLNGIHLTVKAHAKTSKKPVYYYRMSLNTEMNLFKRLMKIKTKAVCHGDELSYLFKVGNIVFKSGTIEEVAVLRFVKMWTNFARAGNPIPEKTSLLNVDWKPVNKQTLHFLDIDRELVPGIDPDIKRMKFWEELSEGINPCY